MRAAWQGYIALGQLGIPVRLYAATQSIRPRFVQLHETDGSPVERELKCRAEDRAIDPGEVIRAVEYEPGRYIALTDRELATTSEAVKTISIQQFCEPHAIPAIHHDKAYYVVPTRGGERAYALLREVLARRAVAAIAQFVIYTKEHIAALGVHGDMLLLYQLRYAAEIVPRSSVKVPALPKPSPSEVDALGAVVDRLNGPFYINDYHDEHAERVQELIERKAKGLSAPRRESVAPHATPEDDIASTLRAMLGESRALAP